jgi:hypothetical protein
MFSDQTGQFLTRSKRGNKYIMVMVEVDSNTILVKPLKSCKDAKLICGYKSLLLQLQQAGIVPWKHVMDNKISKAMKDHIQDECKVKLELVLPGCHRCNAAEVAITNFNLTFSAFWQGLPTTSPQAYGTGCYPKPK